MLGLFAASACGVPLTVVFSLSPFVFLDINENKPKTGPNRRKAREGEGEEERETERGGKENNVEILPERM